MYVCMYVCIIIIIIIIFKFLPSVVKIKRVEAKQKAKEMLERLEVVLRGCVGESALNGNCVVSLNCH